MLTLLFSALLAAAPNTAAGSAPADTVDQYIIDGKIDLPAGFKGTQLVGMSIASYDITYSNEDGKVVRKHNITLAAQEKPGIDMNSFFANDESDYSSMTKTTFISDNSVTITTEGTLKNGNIKHATSTTTVVAPQIGTVVTSTDLSEKTLYIDDRKATVEEFQALKPSDIKKLIILKGEKAVELYGESGRNGVIEIRTNRNEQSNGGKRVFLMPFSKKDTSK